jgi:two-component system, NarL family, response regulator YdfI
MEIPPRRHPRPRAGATAVALVAASAARRAALAEQTVKAFSRGAVEVSLRPALAAIDPALSVDADIIVADLETRSQTAALLPWMAQRRGSVAVVALIDDPDPRWARSALQAGINAIISREATEEELHLALAAADAGLVLLHPASVRIMLTKLLEPPPLDYQYEQLTAREREVLRLLSDGLGNKEIAARLEISEHTAKFHISSILGKLGAATRTEAVTQGIKRGLIAI